ncbi:MAG: hypothetical protein BJ554DRAFT_1318 [Olpidium bornovanus]|uniref:Uncharacterized protein n=1 Tax=Olpidium bornovanus TaxID=278681 RepID=A0A8H8DHA7_9FUNG|nr:MAG: hypothetical protein BJ554DRAFT_1318 [Olpidium bornovanus]
MGATEPAGESRGAADRSGAAAAAAAAVVVVVVVSADAAENPSAARCRIPAADFRSAGCAPNRWCLVRDLRTSTVKPRRGEEEPGP